MHTEEQTKHSILTVSGKKELLPLVRRSLQNECIISAEYANDAASARRCILDRYYTIVVINSPLQGESGVELAIDTACQCSASILLIVPGADHGMSYYLEPQKYEHEMKDFWKELGKRQIYLIKKNAVPFS